MLSSDLFKSKLDGIENQEGYDKVITEEERLKKAEEWIKEIDAIKILKDNLSDYYKEKLK